MCYTSYETVKVRIEEMVTMNVSKSRRDWRPVYVKIILFYYGTNGHDQRVESIDTHVTPYVTSL